MLLYYYNKIALFGQFDVHCERCKIAFIASILAIRKYWQLLLNPYIVYKTIAHLKLGGKGNSIFFH